MVFYHNLNAALENPFTHTMHADARVFVGGVSSSSRKGCPQTDTFLRRGNASCSTLEHERAGWPKGWLPFGYLDRKEMGLELLLDQTGRQQPLDTTRSSAKQVESSKSPQLLSTNDKRQVVLPSNAPGIS